MVACPHERLQIHPLTVKEVKMQNKSWGRSLRLLRVAASSNLRYVPIVGNNSRGSGRRIRAAISRMPQRRSRTPLGDSITALASMRWPRTSSFLTAQLGGAVHFMGTILPWTPIESGATERPQSADISSHIRRLSFGTLRPATYVGHQRLSADAGSILGAEVIK